VSRYEEQPAVRIERRRLEDGAAVIVGQAFIRGAHVVEHDRPAVGADLLGPVRSVDEWLATSSFPIRGPAYKKPVPVRDHDHFSRLAADRQVRLHRHMSRVPIVDVVRVNW